MMNFRVVTGDEAGPLGRQVVWYVECRAEDGRLGIVGDLYEKKADAEAVSKRLNDEQPNSWLNGRGEAPEDYSASI